MKKLYIATAVIALLLALLLLFPARLAWDWWGPPAPAVLVAPQGSVFQGQANYLGLQSLVFEQLYWDAHFWPLLTARMRYDLNAEIAGYPLQTELTLAPTGSIRMRGLQAGLPLAAVAPMLQLPVMPLDGLLALDMSVLKFKGERVLQAEGLAEVRNAEWLLMQPGLSLGNLRAELSTEDGVIRAQLGGSGPLELTGQVLLQEDGSYEADIGLRSAAGAEPRLQNLLNSLGRPVDGWYRIKTRGKLPGSS